MVDRGASYQSAIPFDDPWGGECERGDSTGGRIPSDQVRCAAHCLLFRTEAAVAAQPPAAGDGSTTGTWRWLEADQWEARHTRANHNAYCCRRAVRPHPWIASSTSARRQLLQLGQVEISAGAPFAPLLRFALIRQFSLENISRSRRGENLSLILRIMRSLYVIRCNNSRIFFFTKIRRYHLPIIFAVNLLLVY